MYTTKDRVKKTVDLVNSHSRRGSYHSEEPEEVKNIAHTLIYGATSENASSLFKRLEELGYSGFEFATHNSYGDYSVTLEAERIETDDEYAERQRQIAEQNDRERKE